MDLYARKCHAICHATLYSAFQFGWNGSICKRRQALHVLYYYVSMPLTPHTTPNPQPLDLTSSNSTSSTRQSKTRLQVTPHHTTRGRRDHTTQRAALDTRRESKRAKQLARRRKEPCTPLGGYKLVPLHSFSWACRAPVPVNFQTPVTRATPCLHTKARTRAAKVTKYGFVL